MNFDKPLYDKFLLWIGQPSISEGQNDHGGMLQGNDALRVTKRDFCHHEWTFEDVYCCVMEI
jgi:hypothetical protein